MPHLKISVAALLAAAPALAAATTDTGRPQVNFTGPLVTPAVNTMPVGVLNVEPYLIHTHTRAGYDNAGRRHEQRPKFRQWLVALPMSYGLTDTTTVQLVLNGSRTSGAGMHTDGFRIGDTVVRLQQRLKAPASDGTGLVLAATVAQNLPTGKYHGLDTNPLNGTGNGTSRTSIAFGAQQLHWLPNTHALRWRGQVAWSPSPGRVRVRDASVFGTGHGFRGHARVGQTWNAAVAAEYALDPRWVLVGEAVWNRTATMSVAGAYAGRHHAVHRFAPTQDFSLAPAVEYHFNASVGLIAGVQFSVAGRNSSGYVAPQAALNMAF